MEKNFNEIKEFIKDFFDEVVIGCTEIETFFNCCIIVVLTICFITAGIMVLSLLIISRLWILLVLILIIAFLLYGLVKIVTRGK